jgi:hypothetical protein
VGCVHCAGVLVCWCAGVVICACLVGVLCVTFWALPWFDSLSRALIKAAFVVSKIIPVYKDAIFFYFVQFSLVVVGRVYVPRYCALSEPIVLCLETSDCGA